MRATLPCLCAGLLLSGLANAQRLATFDPAAAAVDELQPVTPLVPGLVPPLAAYPTVPPLPLVPPSLPLGAGPFYNQNVTICPTDPVLGLVLTPMQTIYSAGY